MFCLGLILCATAATLVLCCVYFAKMSGFVLVRRTEDSKEDSIELPTEDDGSLLLSVLQSQFEGASGLRYK